MLFAEVLLIRAGNHQLQTSRELIKKTIREYIEMRYNAFIKTQNDVFAKKNFAEKTWQKALLYKSPRY